MAGKFLVIFSTACAVLCSGASGLPATVKSDGPTRVQLFMPWSSGALARGFTVKKNGAGSCWTHSLSTDRSDAWRCFLGNDILDPCFSESPRSGQVACAEEPFSKTVVILRLTKPLPADENPTTKWLQPKGEPWALRLANGDTCYFATGATDVVGGERMNYECYGGGWIVGFVDRATARWTGRVMVWPNKSRLRQIGIATAVF
jgi:hypothetical protein